MSENIKPVTEQTTTMGEIDLLDILIGLAHHKKWIAGCTIGIGGVALVTSLLMTPIFTSTAKIMPPQQQSSSAAALLGALGGLAGAAGGIAGLKNPNDLYVGMLQSRTVADNLIKKHGLEARYKTDTMVGTRLALEGRSDITAGKDGLITITVDDPDPVFAAKLANGYVDELVALTKTLAVTSGAQRRAFYEKQLTQAKDDLAEAEVQLKKEQENSGLIQIDKQVEAIVSNIAQLKATITAKEVELQTMRAFATEQNPDLIRTQQEIQGLKAQLTQLESGNRDKGSLLVPTGKIPQAGLGYVRKLRDVKYYETMFELLAKQYEMARLDESQDPSAIQVLDTAIPSDWKSKPKRSVITLMGILSGFFIGVVIALFKERTARSLEQEDGGKWKAFKEALKW